VPDALVVIDMQEAAITQGRQHDLDGVISRINMLSTGVRALGGTVIHVLHDGVPGDPWEPTSPGWQISSRMVRSPGDRVVRKRTNDAFHETELDALLDQLKPEQVLICGWATDFCVDSSVRSAVVRGHHVVVVADGHTCDDRAHLPASAIIGHHNTTWSGLIAPGGVEVLTASQIYSPDKRWPA
jgi:nicotinamidase-related amidase